MIKIKNKAACCGCKACAAVCPKKCIKMVTDREGFWYPEVDQSACINCGKCERVCPVLNRKKRQPRKFGRKAYAAINTDPEIRFQSSSGGIFTAIAEAIIDRGGVVFGAAFDKEFAVRQVFAETKEDLAAFRGSKYVQSDMGDAYSSVLRFLQSGRIVLFSGTPCQIGALKSFLGKEYPNLITVDLICHGVPSPMVWEKYVRHRRSLDSDSQLRTVQFRDKERGGC